MSDLWLEFLFTEGEIHLCGLCGNTGIIDTRGRAVSPAGIACGVQRSCICPNGRSLLRATPTPGGDSPAGMTGDSTVRRFTYLLNAMEAAAQAQKPAEQGYAAKRKSVLDFVWLIGESLGEAMRRASSGSAGTATLVSSLLQALRDVVSVADRETAEFIRARAVIAQATKAVERSSDKVLAGTARGEPSTRAWNAAYNAFVVATGEHDQDEGIAAALAAAYAIDGRGATEAGLREAATELLAVLDSSYKTWMLPERQRVWDAMDVLRRALSSPPQRDET